MRYQTAHDMCGVAEKTIVIELETDFERIKVKEEK